MTIIGTSDTKGAVVINIYTIRVFVWKELGMFFYVHTSICVCSIQCNEECDSFRFDHEQETNFYLTKTPQTTCISNTFADFVFSNKCYKRWHESAFDDDAIILRRGQMQCVCDSFMPKYYFHPTPVMISGFQILKQQSIIFKSVMFYNNVSRNTIIPNKNDSSQWICIHFSVQGLNLKLCKF